MLNEPQFSDDGERVDLADSHVGSLLRGDESLDFHSISYSYYENLEVGCDFWDINWYYIWYHNGLPY